MESDCFSTGTALFSREEPAAARSSRLHHGLTGAAGSTSGKAHRAPQKQHYSMLTNNSTKTHPISWCCCYCQDFQGCSFPGEIHGMHTHHVAWFQASIQAVGALIFSLRSHLRLVQVKVNQWQSLLLQLCKGEHLPVAPQHKSKMLKGSCCDAEKWQLRSCFCCARPRFWAKKSLLLCQKVSNSSLKAADGTSLLCQAAGSRKTFCSSNITLHWWGGESFHVSPQQV